MEYQHQYDTMFSNMKADPLVTSDNENKLGPKLNIT